MSDTAGKSRLAALARRPYAALLLLCLLLWAPGIASLPALDRDESRFAQASRQMLESGNFVDIRFGTAPRYQKPAGIYWLQAAATALAGFGHTGEIWTYRLASLIGGIAAVWLAFWCAGALLPPEGALCAASLLAASLLLTAEATIATTDAVLLAAVLAVQGVLLRAYRAAREPGVPAPSTGMLMAGWAALAIGILVKGPVIAGVAVATVAALAVWDRSGAWLARLKPVRGVLVALILVMPWLVAIALQSHGAFFRQSLGGDFAAKLEGGQESHGAWPGYYLLLSALSLWPAILFVAPGIGLGWLRRREPAIRFLLAWAGSWWLVCEAVPTKLPHYILPIYPALAILAALWIVAPPAETPRQRSLRILAGLQFVIGLAAFVAAPVLLPRLYGTGIVRWLAVPAGLGAALGLAALVLFIRQARAAAAACALLAMLVLGPAITAGAGPKLGRLWVSERLAALVRKDSGAADPPPALAGYQEPSLVFALDARVDLTDGRGAADAGADGGGLALVEDREQSAFLARLAERQADAVPLDTLSGFDYSRGHAVRVTLYRVTRQREAGASPLR